MELRPRDASGRCRASDVSAGRQWRRAGDHRRRDPGAAVGDRDGHDRRAQGLRGGAPAGDQPHRAAEPHRAAQCHRGHGGAAHRRQTFRPARGRHQPGRNARDLRALPEGRGLSRATSGKGVNHGRYTTFAEALVGWSNEAAAHRDGQGEGDGRAAVHLGRRSGRTSARLRAHGRGVLAVDRHLADEGNDGGGLRHPDRRHRRGHRHQARHRHAGQAHQPARRPTDHRRRPRHRRRRRRLRHRRAGPPGGERRARGDQRGTQVSVKRPITAAALVSPAPAAGPRRSRDNSRRRRARGHRHSIVRIAACAARTACR